MKNTHISKRAMQTLLCVILSTNSVLAQTKVVLNADAAETQISKHIYGHFAENMGRVIYDGIYVGEDNETIPHTNGVRNDLVKALKDLKIPNLRWPGGCFADGYHWKDGVGPKSERPKTQNIWDNTTEDNSFGTHEFLNFCELVGAEPYLAINMNSGSVQEAVEWLHYVNHPSGSSYITDLREANGRKEPWNVKYWGIGNESWGCGGTMTADYYVNKYRQYATAVKGLWNIEGVYKIGVGPGWDDYDWTETLIKGVPDDELIEGISIHHYSVIDWKDKKSSTEFSDEQYFITMQKAWFMEEFISKNSEVMDKHDPEKKVALIVDEWGGWYEELEPEKNGLLYQQNTIRDAMIAGLSLNVFNNHADRVHMANLAQMVNVLQAVILTEGEKLLLTPTYHVMEMYKVHQDAQLVPTEVSSADFVLGEEKLPSISVSASIDTSDKMHISITNIDNTNNQQVAIELNGYKAKKVSGRILTSDKVQDHNTFDNPEKVVPEAFKKTKLSKGNLEVIIPANSVVVLELME